MHQTIAPAAVPKLKLSSTSWIDQANTHRTHCNTRLAISQFTTHRWTLKTDLRQFPQLGVSGIGLWRNKIEEHSEGRVLQLLRNSGVRATSLSFAGGFAGANGLTFEEALKDGARCVQFAKRAGCPLVLLATGDRGEHTRSHAIKSTLLAIRRLAEFAAERGVRLAIMPMRKHQYRHLSMVSTLDHTLDMIRLVNHPAFGMAFHTYHLGDTPALLDRIPEIADKVFSVHISDLAPSAHAYDQRCPGQGILPLAEIVAAFDKAGYRDAYELNVWSERSWQADYNTVLADCVRYLHENVMLPTPAC